MMIGTTYTEVAVHGRKCEHQHAEIRNVLTPEKWPYSPHQRYK